MALVKPEYGPTLPELLVRLPGRLRWALAAAVAVAVLAVAGVVIASGENEKAVVVREPVTFNLVYDGDSGLRRISQPGALLALERTRGDLFLDSYVVRELRLPAYEGAASGILPVYAEGVLRDLRRRYDGFRLEVEGRTRINNGLGYQVLFRAQRDGRTLFGRHLMLVPEEPVGLRQGVVIELTSTPSATPNLAATGNTSVLKTPLRSFRFGTEREGGEA